MDVVPYNAFADMTYYENSYSDTCLAVEAVVAAEDDVVLVAIQ